MQQQNSAPEGFRYFAFISYSRKDSRAAAFLHKKLEKFRIPFKRVPEEARMGLGKFAKPVFRDKRDLEVGESSFTEDVKNALRDSKFIVVLCSPNSAQSVWVDSEVRYFLATHGGDLSRVAPVILAGNPGSGEVASECLCACLREGETKPAIVNRNLPTMIPDEGESEKIGWEAGVVGVLSYMLKVKRMDIKAAIDAEKMRQMRIYAAIGVVCSSIFAALTLWALKAERNARENWRLAEANRRQAVEQRDRAVEAERLADANRRIAEANEERAVAEEKNAKEKAYLAGQTVAFLQKMLQEARPDEHGQKNVIDLLVEQQSKIDLLSPPELRYSVAKTLGQIMLEQSLAVPASRMLKYAYDFCKANERVGEEDLAGVANLLALAYNAMPGRSEEALALLAEVETLRRAQGEDDFEMAITYLNMAASHFAKKDYAESKALCEKTLACTGGKPCRATVLAYAQGTAIALEQGEYAQAAELCGKAFEASAAMGEEPDADLVETFVLAGIRNGKYDVAKEMAEAALGKLRKRGIMTKAAVALENDLGLIADANGDFKGAIEHYRRALNDGERLWPAGHGYLANIISNLGTSHLKAGGTTAAVQFFSRAIGMMESLEGPDSFSLYLPLVNIAVAHKYGGEYGKSREALERAYNICVKKFGSESARLPDVLFHIADLQDIKGEKETAKTGYEEAMRLMRLNGQSETELMVSCMASLAACCRATGEAERAKSLIEEAADLARRILPVGNDIRRLVMRSYENIAQAPSADAVGVDAGEFDWNAKKAAASEALKEERNDEAEALYLELLRHLENTAQTFTTDYDLVHNQLGLLAERKGDLRGALAHYAKSRDVGFAIRGTNDIEVAVTCYNMAGVLRRLGDSYGEEIALLRALPAYEATSGNRHETVSDIYTYLGRLKERQKAWQESLAWYEKALAFDIAGKGTNSISVAIDYEDIGDVRNESGDYAAAKDSYCSAIAVRKELGESETTQKMGYLNNEIGNALWRAGNKSDALPYYKNSYEIDLANYGLTNGNTVVALGNLGGCERAAQDYANAIAHLALAAEMKRTMPEFDAHDYGLAMNELAIAQSDSGDHEGALRTYAVALEHDLRALGREDENVMTVYANMAAEYQMLGRLDDAIATYRKALDIALLLHGEENAKSRGYYRSLGDCLCKAEKYDKCAAIRKKYLEIVQGIRTLGPEYAAKAHALYADALQALNDYSGETANRACAVEAYSKCGNDYRESVAVSLCRLGYAQRRLGEFDAAVKSFSEAKQIFEAENITCTKGNDFDLAIHEKLDESRKLAAGELALAIMMTEITEGGQAERLGVRTGDVWCRLDEWRAADYPDGKGLWHSLVTFMERFGDKPRLLTVCRKENGEWVKKTFQFEGGAGGFVYGFDVLPSEEFNAMLRQTKTDAPAE